MAETIIVTAGEPMGDVCKACGEPFATFDSRVSWTVEGWKYPTIGPIHEKCQRRTSSQQDALDKVLSAARSLPPEAANG